MLFKDSVRFKHGTLNRGDECLWKSWQARYLGSFRSNGKAEWNHLFEVDDSVLVERDFKNITTNNNKEPELEGQMQLC